MKWFIILIFLLTGMAGAWGKWYLKSCDYSQYNIGGRIYYGYVGIYEKNGEYISHFFGGKYCPYSIDD